MRLIDGDALLEKFNRSGVDTWMALTDKDASLAFALYCKVADAVEEMPTVGGWFSIEDRLPDDARRVLCCTKTQKGIYNIVIGYYMGGLWRCGMNSNVVYWMELPKVPE